MARQQAEQVSSGELLRQARKSRRLSQLDLALRVGASQRHLSFVETGRSSASRGMLIALADALGMSPAGCNQLLLASGFSPRYGQRPLDDRQMAPVRQALQHLLSAHDPFPAWVLDPCWNLLQCNRGADLLVASITGRRLSDQVGQLNVLRAILHPDGLRPAIENFDEVAAHLFHQSRAEAAYTPALAQLLKELEPLWPASVVRRAAADGSDDAGSAGPAAPVLATTLRTPSGRLSFFSAFTTFGTPLDITVASLRVEHQFPADPQTDRLMRQLADAGD
ncbi:MAG: helix-turn-helix transcriptional regulator [Lautropia sp.]|nr:helix-turn-helix transcriptional regulator [Lautropia sp.]